MRKMTDEQLVHYVEDRVAKADSEGFTLFYVSENNIIYLESLIPNSVIVQDAQAITPISFYALSSEKFFQFVKQDMPTFQNMFSHMLGRIILLHEYILCSHFRESSKRGTI